MFIWADNQWEDTEWYLFYFGRAQSLTDYISTPRQILRFSNLLPLTELDKAFYEALKDYKR